MRKRQGFTIVELLVAMALTLFTMAILSQAFVTSLEVFSQLKGIGDMEAGFGGGFVKARAELGVSAFGMQVIQMPPNYGDYPEHDHADSGQEEVFIALEGSGWMDIEGERVDLDGETLVRVGAGAKRKLYAGPEGIRMLAIGGAPGQAYKAPEVTELTGAAS